MNELLACCRTVPASASLLQVTVVGHSFWFHASRKSQKPAIQVARRGRHPCSLRRQNSEAPKRLAA